MSTSTSFPAELRLPAPRPKAIDVAAALEQVGGDFEFVMAVMRDEFLAKVPDQIARCAANARVADAHPADATDVAAKEKRDAALKALAFEAHSMKGASATLHADALSKACHRLERTAKGVPLDALDPDISLNDAGGPLTFEQRTREMADRLAELEEDVADLVAISDVDVAAASEALGSGLGVTLARLAGNAAELAASPAAMTATAATARGAANAEDDEKENERLRALARAVAADADAVGARALRDAARQMDALVFSFSVSADPTPTAKKRVEENHVRVDLEARETRDGRDENMAERLVAACVELRAAAQTVAFDCAAVCSFEETAGFVKKAQEACGVPRDDRDTFDAFGTDALRCLAGIRLADASARRGEGFFDAAATAEALRRAFATSSTRSATENETKTETRATPGSNRVADDFESARVTSLPHPHAQERERVPPVDFPRAVRALDGDVAFAEKMLRTFLADAETFASKPLDALESTPPSPPGSREVNDASDGGPKKKCERRRLSEKHRRDAQRLGETADWLGAPPLRAAIATLLDGDASEQAVHAARRAVRDLRAFADGLESDLGRGDEKQNRAKRDAWSVFSRRDVDDEFRRASPPLAGSGSGSGARLSSSQTLPKKSASTDEVMRSGLYAYSSSSLTNSGGGSADSNEDSDEKSRRGSVGSDADRDGARSSTDSRDERAFRRRGSWGGSSGRVSADSAGAAEGAVTALAALSPRARARGLAALRTPRRRHGALPFDLRRALERADGDWDFAVGCAGRHAALAREQIAVLRAVLFADARRGAENDKTNLNLRDDAQIVASAIAQLRSVAEGASVSHAPRLMDAVEALAAALVSAAAELSCGVRGTGDATSSVQTVQPSTWRPRSLKLLRSLEKRADEYVAAVDAVANTSRAFSPRFVFSDACGGDAALAVEKIRVLVLAARDAHVAAVRAVAAAEASFGAEALGGAFRDEREEETRGVSSHSSSDEGDASQTRASGISSRALGAREKKPLSARVDGDPTDGIPRDVLDDVRYGLSGAFGSLEACERLASSLCARPSERAFRGAASRVARIAVDISAAAAGGAVAGKGLSRLKDAPVVPACFLDDEHAQTVAALAALKREVEALAADFHAIAPDAAVPAAVGKRGKKNVSDGFFSRLFGAFDVFGNERRGSRRRRHHGNGNENLAFDSRVDFDLFWRTVPARAARAARDLRASLSSENAAVGAATALFASYTVARLCGAFFLASAGDA